MRGPLDTVAAEIERAGDVYLRVELVEPPRPGLADSIRALSPERVVDVRLVGDRASGAPSSDQDAIDRLRRSPRELFAEYLEEAGKTDPRLLAMFDSILDELNAPDPA